MTPTDIIPRYANVLVVEDERGPLKRLKRQYAEELEYANIIVATNMVQFEKCLYETRIDAASIDWELHKACRGPDILGSLKKEHPGSANIVYSKHEDCRSEAFRFKADFCLFKNRDNPSIYLDTMRKGIRLGFSRQIALMLSTMNLPLMPHGKMITDEDELIVCEASRKVAMDSMLRNNPNKGLIELLRDRSWWRVFDLEEYVSLPISGKLSRLLDYAEIDTRNLAVILGITEPKAEGLLAENTWVSQGETIRLNASSLFSLLGYTLKRTNYQPELLASIWRDSGESKTMDLPPWDGLGIGPYLEAQGPTGITKCSQWIWRHIDV